MEGTVGKSGNSPTEGNDSHLTDGQTNNFLTLCDKIEKGYKQRFGPNYAPEGDVNVREYLTPMEAEAYFHLLSLMDSKTTNSAQDTCQSTPKRQSKLTQYFSTTTKKMDAANAAKSRNNFINCVD